MLPEDNQTPKVPNASEEESSDKRDKIGYWLKWIKGAKKSARRHWRDADSAYREYELPESEIGDDLNRDKPPRGYNIYAESCWTLEPALYSKTPKVVGKRRHGIEDDIALTMALQVERLGQHLVDNGCFDEGMYGARGDFIHAAKATTQIVYKADKQNVDGVESVIEGSQKIYLSPVLHDEVLHTPEAKVQSEITEIAYKFCLSYEEAEEKFNTGPNGENLNKSLPYGTSKTYEDKKSSSDEDDNKESPGRQLEGWEIYSLTTKKVYWVCEEYGTDFLTAPKPDPYGFRGFFPSPPFIIKNKKRKSLYPTPTWIYLEATANQLHVLYERLFGLIDAVRRRALVYGASQEVIDALNKLDGLMYINVSDVADILEKGGVNKMIEWIEVADLVQAISECLNLEQHFSERFNLGFGVPDILRGISDPEETAAAQTIKSSASHDRFKNDKKQIVDLARNSAEMMLDLALAVYSPTKIAKICGYDFLEKGDPGTPETPAQPPTQQNPQGVAAVPGTPPKPSHYENFFIALERLKNDEDRIVTIDFETDSTNFRDEGRDIQKAQIIADLVQKSLAAIGSAQNSALIPIAVDILLGTLDTMGGSTKLENMIKKAAADLQKVKDTPAPPPPPDPQEVKNQIAMQQQQIDQATTARELQQKDIELQLKQQSLAGDQRIKEIETSLKQQIEGMKIALQDKEAEIANAKRIDQAQEAVAKVQTKERELDVKTEMLQRDTEISQLKLVNERQINEMFASLEAQRIANDSLRIKHEEVLSKLRIVESYMEEERLGKQARVDNTATLVNAASMIGVPGE